MHPWRRDCGNEAPSKSCLATKGFGGYGTGPEQATQKMSDGRGAGCPSKRPRCMTIFNRGSLSNGDNRAAYSHNVNYVTAGAKDSHRRVQQPHITQASYISLSSPTPAAIVPARDRCQGGTVRSVSRRSRAMIDVNAPRCELIVVHGISRPMSLFWPVAVLAHGICTHLSAVI